MYRPPFLATVSSYLIPGITVFLGIAIGMTLRIGKVGLYRREIAMIMGIKFCIIPLVNIPLGYLLGLGRIMEGVPLKIVVILSFMPVAFVAVIPPGDLRVWSRPGQLRVAGDDSGHPAYLSLTLLCGPLTRVPNRHFSLAAPLRDERAVRRDVGEANSMPGFNRSKNSSDVEA